MTNSNSPPVHPQLMDPAADPEEFIRASVYWYPLLFPTRTEVLDHLMLTDGNGYEWGADGNVRSVFAHIKPDYDRLDSYEASALRYEAQAREKGDPVGVRLLLEWAAEERAEHARLLAIRTDYRNLARTYGPVQEITDYGPAYGKQARMISARDLDWTLLGRAPANVTPAWQRIITETRALFAPVLIEQGALF